MEKIFHEIAITAIVVGCVSLFGVAHAEPHNYQAGEFRITIDEDGENGKTYRGCDRQGNCISLNNGTTWRDRGITWENGEYTYSVSWRENSNQPMYLIVNRGNRRILRRQLIPVDN